jgi:hypothetical protein
VSGSDVEEDEMESFGRRVRANGDEQDAFGRGHNVYIWRAGQRRTIKARASRRARHSVRTALRTGREV